MSYLYDDFLPDFQKKIDTYLTTIKANFNFDLGIEFEIQLCKLLRIFLPSKYGICRGFVVNRHGDKAGDDIIIYDQDRFPTLRLLPKDDFSLKEEIPIEAVYAYLEIKHNLTEESLTKAIDQVAAVKKLVSQRTQVSIYQTDPYIASDFTQLEPVEYLPSFRNPVFCAIIGKFSNGIEDSELVDDFLRFQTFKLLKKEDFRFYPELIIGGPNNIARTSYVKDHTTFPTIFHDINNYGCMYQVLKTPNLSFAITFTYLMVAIDFIRLGQMPWAEILNDGTGHE
jgi:hypothetical protein